MSTPKTYAALLTATLSLASCYEEPIVAPPAPPPPAPASTVFIRVGPTETTSANGSAQRIALPSAAVERVRVYTDKNVGRPTEVVGVLDFHTNAESQDKGFELLKARAAALGADAVVGAEFEHGDGSEPSHLSGMAVRFTDR